MKRIYIASPYSGSPAEMEGRHDSVCSFVATMINKVKDVVWYSPIAKYHTIARFGKLPTGFDYWQKINYAEIDLSDELHVLCLSGWKESTGVQAEIDRARAIGIPVTYVMISDNTYSFYCEAVNQNTRVRYTLTNIQHHA